MDPTTLPERFQLGPWRCSVELPGPWTPLGEIIIRGRRDTFVTRLQCQPGLLEAITELYLLQHFDEQYAQRNHYRIRVWKMEPLTALRCGVSLRRRWIWECNQCRFEDQSGHRTAINAEIAAQNHIDEQHAHE